MINPTRAAVMVNGRIAVEGGPEIITRIDTAGYEWIRDELGIEIEKPREDQPMNKVSIGACATRVGLEGKK